MIFSQEQQRWEWIVCAGFFGVFLAYIFFYATAPIADPDFWWHLKTGEIMAQNGGLLQSDPFNFTGEGVVANREAIILKGYWLWQLTAYGLYALLGFSGIFLLNFLTIGAMVGVVALQMRRQRVDYALAIGLMTLGFTLVRSTFPLERPQLISFLLAAILLALLDRVREGGQLGWWLPLLMLIWANLHGGFVVGDLLLFSFAVGAIIEYRHDVPRLRHLLSWVALGFGASLLNPNGALVFVELLSFHNSTLMTSVSEYQSTWSQFQKGSWYLAILWLLIALYGVGLWRAPRRYWPELFMALFLAYFSVAHMRNVGFFAVAMLPAIGFNLQQGGALRLKPMLPIFKYLIVILAALFLLWRTYEHWQIASKEKIINSFYPEATAQFILASGLQGRMFNSYNFGGYFIWKLYPRHRVFIDGRGLDPDIYNDWMLMTSASLKEEGGRKEFEVLLERYGIDYVVQPLVYFGSGRLTPLLKFLMIKPEWIPVYIDQQSFILVRNSPKNATVIERYQLDKRDFNHKTVGFLTALCKNSPTTVINHVALAEMLIFVGRYDEAEKRLEVIARLQPDNPNLPALRNQLDVLKKGSKP